MLFVNYVLDLNNGFRAKVVVEESKDIYLEGQNLVTVP